MIRCCVDLSGLVAQGCFISSKDLSFQLYAQCRRLIHFMHWERC